MGNAMSDQEKLIVFVDYQNAYMSAREDFFSTAEHYTSGQFNPLRLGELLTERDNAVRDDGRSSSLYQVRIYCGLPDSRKDSHGNGARLRQIQAWGRMQGVQALHRPLRYPTGYPSLPPQEKGVDVQIAVDVIRMALQGEYQVGVIFSRDTDLRPVLESMMDLYSRTGVKCHAGAWYAGSGPRRGLTVPRRPVWCHYLDWNDFRLVQDLTDYRKEPPGAVRPSWAR